MPVMPSQKREEVVLVLESHHEPFDEHKYGKPREIEPSLPEKVMQFLDLLGVEGDARSECEKWVMAERKGLKNLGAGAFDFSRQAGLLHTTLQVAVPLWFYELEELFYRSVEEFDRTCKRWTEDASAYLAAHGDALMFKVEGKSAKAFNHLARGIAVMAFCPGGVEVFGSRWQVNKVPR